MFLRNVVLCAVASLLLSQAAYAEMSWLKPTFSAKEKYTSNVFLSKNDTKGDMITTLSPGLVFAPVLAQHQLTAAYKTDYMMFSEYDKQNSANHTASINTILNFTDWKLAFGNTYKRFKDRSSTEISARTPRESNKASLKGTYSFNRADVSVILANDLDRYRQKDTIGTYEGHDVTYKDLSTSDSSVELESAFKFWPKTAWLLATRYGEVDNLSGRKSDSAYYDILTGLRGEIFTKGVIEGKIGFRSQDFDSASSKDFDGMIFSGLWQQNFTPRDTLQVSVDRKSETTSYTNNSYMTSTFYFMQYVHGFTDKFASRLKAGYQTNYYPTETTEGSKTDHREDAIFTSGAGLTYKLTKWGELAFDYDRNDKQSNFSQFDYLEHVVSTEVNVKF